MKSQQVSIKAQFQSLKEGAKKKLIVGSLIATFIAITPYLFTLYESVPKTKSWDTFFGTYDSGYYQSMYIFAWTLTVKIIPFILILIWFFTCRHWWYHSLLVPIIMYTSQIYTVLRTNDNDLDVLQLVYMLPIMTIIIPTIYLIRARIFKKINETTKSMQELEDEFKMSPKNIWEKIKLYF